jgi:hypothetical protein
VQEQVAAIIGSRPLRATPPLKALARVASGLIVTTNCDLAVEETARAVGRQVES